MYRDDAFRQHSGCFRATRHRVERKPPALIVEIIPCFAESACEGDGDALAWSRDLHNVGDVQTTSPITRRPRCPLFQIGILTVAILATCSAAVLMSTANWFSTSAGNQRPVHVVDVAPQGWRRTVDGWERADRWFVPAGRATYSIDQWIAVETARQSSPAQTLLVWLRQVHPLAYSISLLLTVVSIVLISERIKAARGDASSAPPVRNRRWNDVPQPGVL